MIPRVGNSICLSFPPAWGDEKAAAPLRGHPLTCKFHFRDTPASVWNPETTAAFFLAFTCSELSWGTNEGAPAFIQPFRPLLVAPHPIYSADQGPWLSLVSSEEGGRGNHSSHHYARILGRHLQRAQTTNLVFFGFFFNKGQNYMQKMK